VSRENLEAFHIKSGEVSRSNPSEPSLSTSGIPTPTEHLVIVLTEEKPMLVRYWRQWKCLCVHRGTNALFGNCTFYVHCVTANADL